MTVAPIRRRDPAAAFLLAVVVPLLVFALLAAGVTEGREFGWDAKLVRLFDEHYADLRVVNLVTKGLVYLSMVAGAIFALFLLLALLARRQRAQALFWGFAVGGALVLDPVLKEVFRRPPLGDPEGGYSFPSGNAMASTAAVTALLLLFPPVRRRALLVLLAGLAVAANGLALVFLLWHYPSDVVAGWCVAIAWVTGLWLVFRPTLARARPRLPSSQAAPRSRSAAASGRLARRGPSEDG